MPDLSVAPAWTALFLGLFAFFAGLGALRRPGHWQKLVEEIAASPALQLITAMLELFLGAAVYIVNPWASADWLSGAMSILGGLMMLEALVVLAFSDAYLSFWLRRLGSLEKLWAWLAMAFGAALIIAGALHF